MNRTMHRREFLKTAGGGCGGRCGIAGEGEIIVACGMMAISVAARNFLQFVTGTRP